MKPILYLVIPCYNEEQVLPLTSNLFSEKMRDLIAAEKIHPDSKVLFVDDGSRDGTWNVIERLAKESDLFTGVALSRNRGHQNALLAGLHEAADKCDVTVSVDCDGQDDINAIDKMLEEYANGAEIVYGVRNDRKTDSFFKRSTAQTFYKFLSGMGVETVYNHADYRLLSARAVKELENFKEVNVYLRGMIPLIGFKSTCVLYERKERLAGKTHYPLKKMLSLAIDGVTSLSVKPIRLITVLGFLIALASFFGVLWSVISYFLGVTVAGWASLVSILCFFSGVQLLSIGVIGEYIGKIYLETKARPRFIIEKRTEEKK